MQRIDAHQHFWNYDPLRDDWITNEMPVLKRDFLPGNLAPLLHSNGFEGCVAVQADQSEAETLFLLDCADKYDFIKGVVGWTDLRSNELEERLHRYSTFKKLKGFRHILQGESRRDLMLSEEFKKGISLLSRFNFTYDILIFPDQLKYIPELAAAFPEQKFVLDHMAKPPVKSKEIDTWKDGIVSVAKHKNVYCKISGLVTEADWEKWTTGDFKPYIDTVVDTFGMNRLLFGSDWPVCLLGGSYNNMVDLVEDYFSSFTKDEKEKLFGKNAIRFYNL